MKKSRKWTKWRKSTKWTKWRKSTKWTTWVLVALLSGASAVVDAHHSFAVFDLTAQKSIEGTVKKVDWTNPHVWIWVDVPTTSGAPETYGFEGMSPNFLARRGWSRTTLQTGMKVTVQYRPLKDGKPGGMLMSAKLPSGLLLTGGGAQQQ